MPTYLPSASHSFSIPSIHDGARLACRIYLPQGLGTYDRASYWRPRGAIVAHPYAPLGGCYDDPVVSFVGRELLDAGYVVGTFNFRGAGDSEGRTSWTAKPELGDYVSFYGFMVFYVHFLSLMTLRQSEGENAFDDSRRAASPHIVLGGYSYGSLVASHLPANNAILDLFKGCADSSPLHEIYLSAKAICALSEDLISAQTGSSISRISHALMSRRETLDGLTPTISYLLVSPLLPPVNLFLTLFSNLSLEVGSYSGGEHRQISCPKPADQLCIHDSLALYGDEDTFTSANKLRIWADELSNTPQSRFISAEIEGAGHFWREDGVESHARNVLREWLRQQS